jgi:hypothetical protein
MNPISRLSSLSKAVRFCGFLLAAVAIAAPLAFAGVNRWTSSGPHGASINSLAIDPTNPDIVYAGNSRAVFRSRDGGLSWASTLSFAPSFPSWSGLAIHPLSSSTVFAALRGGIFKSTDAGTSWSGVELPPTFSNAVGFDVAIDPSNPSNVLAGTSQGVFRSTDGGARWGLVLARRVYDIVFAAQGPSVFGTESPYYYYYYYYPTGLWKSSNAGADWSGASSSLRIPQGALAIDPTNSATLYAGSYSSVHKSVDSGSTWRRHDSNLEPVWVRALVIDPRNPRTMYAAGGPRGIYRSIDGGVTWREFNTGAGSRYVRVLAIDSTGTRLHAGGGSGDGVFDHQIHSGPLDLSVGADGRARLLFVDLENRAVFRSFDNSGGSIGASHGPLSGWYATAVADGPDGLTRLLWNNIDGSAGVWLLGPTGHLASYAYNRYGPAFGWTAVDVAVGRDGAAHLLWTNTDGRTAIVSVDASWAVIRSLTFGPYPGWLARSISDGPDGLTRLLWSNTDGRIGLSLIDAGGIAASYRLTPPAGWAPKDLTVAADNRARILLADGGAGAALWTVDNSGTVASSGPVYAPSVAGETAARVSAGADGLTRLLWTSSERTGTVWLLDLNNVRQSSFAIGPN